MRTTMTNRSLTLAARSRPALIGLGVASVLLISVPSILLRPTGIEWAAWWPAAGVAVGLLLRTPRHAVWPVLAALTVVFMAAQLVAGRDGALAVVLGLAAGLEVAVAHAILRGARDRPPQLVRFSDFAALLGAALAGPVILAIVAVSAVAALVSPATALDYLQTSVPAHAVGILVVTPLFFDLGTSRARQRPIEFGLQWASAVGTLAIVAVAGGAGLPLAFLLLGPLVWGAARIGGRAIIVQFVVVMVFASEFAPDRGGLIAVEGVAPETGALMAQLFVLSSGIVVFAVLALAASQQRTLRISSTAIAASLTGFAELEGRGGRWTATPLNDSAQRILGLESRLVEELFAEGSSRQLLQAAERARDGVEPLGFFAKVHTRDDRVLQATVSPLLDPDQERRGDVRERYSLQFVDITDTLRVARAEAADLLRAAEIQRALLPAESPDIPGWDVAGVCRPSRDVGGDFFDWAVDGALLSVTLGDVMGKGVGAGVMAASMRMALRLQPAGHLPGEVMTRAAEVVADDLSRASTFVTLFHAQVDVSSGLVRYADAGHGLSIIVRAGGGYERLESVNLPLGVLAGEVWGESTDQVGPGDLLLSMSDGVLDVYEDSDDPLSEIADIARAAGTAQAVVDALAALATEQTVVDDITVVAVRRQAWAPRVALDARED